MMLFILIIEIPLLSRLSIIVRTDYKEVTFAAGIKKNNRPAAAFDRNPRPNSKTGDGSKVLKK
jgi:hypothetical protein